MFLFVNRVFKRAVIGFIGKLSRSFRDFPQILCPYTCTASSIVNTPNQCGTFVPVGESTLTCCHHLISIVYTVVLGGAHSVRMDKRIMTRISSVIQNSFLALKILCALPVVPSSTSSPGNHFIILPIKYNHKVYVFFSDWLLSLSNVHLNFSGLFMARLLTVQC